MYLYFLVRIHSKSRADLSGAERYVYDKVWPENGRSNNHWIPRNQTFSLAHHFEDMSKEETKLKELLQGLGTDVHVGLTKFEEFEARLETLQARMKRSGN